MKVSTHRRIELNNTYTTKSREQYRCFIWVSSYSSTFDTYRVILAMAKVGKCRKNITVGMLQLMEWELFNLKA